jgi:hypothetical protein
MARALELAGAGARGNRAPDHRGPGVEVDRGQHPRYVRGVHRQMYYHPHGLAQFQRARLYGRSSPSTDGRALYGALGTGLKSVVHQSERRILGPRQVDHVGDWPVGKFNPEHPWIAFVGHNLCNDEAAAA